MGSEYINSLDRTLKFSRLILEVNAPSTGTSQNCLLVFDDRYERTVRGGGWGGGGRCGAFVANSLSATRSQIGAGIK